MPFHHVHNPRQNQNVKEIDPIFSMERAEQSILFAFLMADLVHLSNVVPSHGALCLFFARAIILHHHHDHDHPHHYSD